MNGPWSVHGAQAMASSAYAIPVLRGVPRRRCQACADSKGVCLACPARCSISQLSVDDAGAQAAMGVYTRADNRGARSTHPKYYSASTASDLRKQYSRIMCLLVVRTLSCLSTMPEHRRPWIHSPYARWRRALTGPHGDALAMCETRQAVDMTRHMALLRIGFP